MTYGMFEMQQEDENREDLDRARAAGNLCDICDGTQHTTDTCPARKFRNGEIRLELAGMFSNQHGNDWTGYAISDGWRSTVNDQEQFIVHNPDGAQMARFDYAELVPYEVKPEPPTITQAELIAIVEEVRERPIEAGASARASKRRALEAVIDLVRTKIAAQG